MSGGSVIFVDDEEHLRIAAKQTLDLADFDAEIFCEAEPVLNILGRQFDGILVTDICLPGMDGMDLMRRALELDPELPVVLVTGHGDIQLAVEAMRDGAYDFIEKPFSSSQLIEVIRRAIDKRNLTLEARQLQSAAGGRDYLEDRVHGRSPAMVEFRRQLRSVAQSNADVLIIGDTGAGKEVAARALHEISSRKDRPFVAINCGALPAGMVESELFGHEPGAFPGAVRARYGKFEHAQGGTIFLDEIETMPNDVQVKLLRVIEERSVTRLGSNDAVELDVRFVAASQAELEPLAETGQFRSDLLYRLNVVTLRVPTLDQREEDIPGLFAVLVNEACARYRRDMPPIPASVLSRVANSQWPGNVRQLRNAADRYVLGFGLIEGDDNIERSGGSLADRVARFEKNVIAAELVANGGKLKPTYETLGLSRKALYEKMRKYSLNRQDFGLESD